MTGTGTFNVSTLVGVRSTGSGTAGLNGFLVNDADATHYGILGQTDSTGTFFLGTSASASTLGTPAITFNTSGAVTMPQGGGLSVTGTGTVSTGFAVGNATPGAGGIAFPATAVAVADANTLDDYEEGTFNGGSLTGVNLTSLSLAYGNYTKVGRLVTLNFAINATVTSSNTLTYVALSPPFTASVNTSGSGFLNNNIRDGFAQIVTTTLYVFFPAASAPVSGDEVIIASITYIV